LGPVEFALGKESVRIGSPMARALFAYLLLWPNQFVPIARLAGALWQNPPTSAAANLRTYAARVREALGQAGLSDRLANRRSGGYRLAVRPGELDVDRFRQLAAKGRVALHAGDYAAAAAELRAAIGLWRGRAGDDVPVHGSLGQYLNALNEHRLTTSEDLIEVRLALGETQEPVREARVLVAEYPLRERPWGHLMRALYRSGDPSAALAAYDQVRTAFRESLGIEPSVDLQRLQLAILRRDDDALLVSHRLLRAGGPSTPVTDAS
jgi:DNA-binding SARP family transcriptional activator